MSLPNVNITLGNGNIGTVTLSDDGISGLILSGKAVDTKLALDKVYILAGTSDLKKYGLLYRCRRRCGTAPAGCGRGQDAD